MTKLGRIYQTPSGTIFYPPPPAKKKAEKNLKHPLKGQYNVPRIAPALISFAHYH